MDSRVNKYRETDSSMSRVAKNEELYKDITNSDIDNYTVKSNATVLGSQENEIDIEKIKKILDTKYKETAQRRSIRIEREEENHSVVPESTTKEYDLNSFLAKARDDKEETYEEARAKKLRDTQFDILNNLHLPEEEQEKKSDLSDDEDLMNLINTITINEVKKKDNAEKQQEKDNESDEKPLEPLDILTDLKGNENTEVIEGIKEEIEKIEKTSKVLENKNDDIDKTFYTTENSFKKKDFIDEDFEDMDKMSIGVKILIVFIVIVFLIGLFLFLKSYFNF